MPNVLVISTLFLVTGIFISIVDCFGVFKNKKVSRAIGTIGLIFIMVSIIFGFLIYGFGYTVKYETKLIKDFEFVKTPYSLIIDTPYRTKKLDDIKYYNLYDYEKNLRVVLVKGYNSYGLKVRDEIKVGLKDTKDEIYNY